LYVFILFMILFFEQVDMGDSVLLHILNFL
jgi:hypothetical protein